MSYKEEIKKAMNGMMNVWSEIPQIGEEQFDFDKIIGNNIDQDDLIYAINRILERKSSKDIEIIKHFDNKIRVFKVRSENVFSIFNENKNGKRKTICNISEDEFSDIYDNTVIIFDEIIEELMQIKIEELNGHGRCDPDYEYIDNLYLEGIQKLPQEKQEKYMSLFLKGVRERKYL